MSAGTVTQGRRIEWGSDDPHAYPPLAPGDYCLDPEGLWWVYPPGGHMGTLVHGPDGHKVTEHEDGSITVSPSILISDGTRPWHGYLERGVWREV